MKYSVKSCQDIISDPANYLEEPEVFNDWIVEGDLAIVCSDSNSGKTVLCSDIAISNAVGLCYWNEPFSDRSRKVVYVDGELSNRQVANRYKDMPEFAAKKFLRATLNSSTRNYTTEEKLTGLEKLLDEETGTELLIVDNLMTLLNNSTSAREVKYCMERLKGLKAKYDLTLIVVAHFHKRNPSTPLSLSDIQGSSVIGNYADSIIAIGNSCEAQELKYLKLLKTRSIMKPDEVIMVELKKEPYLHFEPCGYDDEEKHLPKSGKSRSSISDLAGLEILRLSSERHSIREIAEIMNLSKSAVGRFIKKTNNLN